MDILKIVLYIVFVIDCIALSAIILLQEGKSAGLGTIGGVADSYWGQNKGRSMEGIECLIFFCPVFRMRSGKNCRSHNRQSESGKSEIEEKERRERMQE